MSDSPVGAGIEVLVLGPAELRVDGVSVGANRPLERALAVRLALAGGNGVPDHILVRDLWGEPDISRPAERLRVLASRLRRQLGDHAGRLRRTRVGYQLDITPADAAAVEDALPAAESVRRLGDHQVRFDVAGRALTRWRGSSLSDLPRIPFAVTEGARLDALRLDLQIHWIEAGLALGRDEVGDVLDRLVTEHPLHERLVGLSAMALSQAGRRAEALDRLARLRETLGNELGIDPTPATEAIEESIRSSASTLPRFQWSVPGAFLGRDGEQASLLRRVAVPCLVTLTGGPGVGKTRLAREVAAVAADHGRPVAWLDLAPLGAPESIAAGLAAAVGVEDATTDLLTKCVAALSGALLVVDNAEHLVDATAALINNLRWQPAGISVLVTSQRPLRVAGEEQHRVEPLSPPAAAALFCGRSGLAPGPEVDAICAAVDWLPLAVELAAGLTRTLSLTQLAGRIDDRLRLLDHRPRDSGARHTSLRAALDWSHELLDTPSRTVLRRLAVFAGGWTLDAAEYVVSGAGIDPADVAAILTDLADRCLVTVDIRGDGHRFRLLETVRDYAFGQLRSAGEESAVRRRHVDWCTEFVATFDRFGRKARSDQVEPPRRVGVEEANLLSAIEWCLGSGAEPARASPIVAPLWWHWPARGLMAEAIGWLRQSLAALPADSAEYAAALSTLASLTRNSGRLDEARVLGEQTLAAYRSLRNDGRVLIALMSLCRTCLALGDMTATLDNAHEAERLARVTGDVAVRIAALNYLGLASRNLGLAAEAEALFTEAMACWEQNDDRPGVALGLDNLAILARQSGDFRRASKLALEGLRIARETRFTAGMYGPLETLGCVAVATGDPAEAVRLLSVAAHHRARDGAPAQVPDEVADLDAAWKSAREALGPDADAIVDGARRLSMEAVIDQLAGQ